MASPDSIGPPLLEEGDTGTDIVEVDSSGHFVETRWTYDAIRSLILHATSVGYFEKRNLVNHINEEIVEPWREWMARNHFSLASTAVTLKDRIRKICELWIVVDEIVAAPAGHSGCSFSQLVDKAVDKLVKAATNPTARSMFTSSGKALKRCENDEEFRKALEKLVTKMKNHDHKGREKAARRQEDRKKKQSRDKARRDHLKMAYQARNVGAVGKLVDQQETEIVEAEMPHKRPKKARVYTTVDGLLAGLDEEENEDQTDQLEKEVSDVRHRINAVSDSLEQRMQQMEENVKGQLQQMQQSLLQALSQAHQR